MRTKYLYIIYQGIVFCFKFKCCVKEFVRCEYLLALIAILPSIFEHSRHPNYELFDVSQHHPISTGASLGASNPGDTFATVVAKGKM